jgi:hypothetical protein
LNGYGETRLDVPLTLAPVRRPSQHPLEALLELRISDATDYSENRTHRRFSS